jgi:hypothetical protein
MRSPSYILLRLPLLKHLIPLSVRCALARRQLAASGRLLRSCTEISSIRGKARDSLKKEKIKMSVLFKRYAKFLEG